jgi:hypothetical protein
MASQPDRLATQAPASSYHAPLLSLDTCHAAALKQAGALGTRGDRASSQLGGAAVKALQLAADAYSTAAATLTPRSAVLETCPVHYHNATLVTALPKVCACWHSSGGCRLFPGTCQKKGKY